MEAVNDVGLKPDLPWLDYLRDPSVNQSALKEMLKSPAHFMHYMIHGRTKEVTDAMIVGKAAHCAILEPHRFSHAYAIAPDGVDDRRTKAWKEHLGAFPDKTCLTSRAGNSVTEMANAIRSKPSARALMDSAGVNEASFFWRDAETGLTCKGRADRILAGVDAIVDLKTTADCRPHAFARTIANGRYHTQAGFYLDGASAALGRKLDTFLILAYEPDPPYAACVYSLAQEAIDAGRAEYRTLLRMVRNCTDSGRWPDRSANILSIGLPAWDSIDLTGLEDLATPTPKPQ